MFKKEKMALLSLYAVSPIHAGSGSSLSAIDLPIQRERHTQWPHIQASAVKGAIRAHYRDYKEDSHAMINQIFGSDTQDGGKDTDMLPASVSFSDAKLFAFPVRSNKSPFVWVTSPMVLKRLHSDLLMMGEKADDLLLQSDSKNIGFGTIEAGKTLLEDYVIDVHEVKSELPKTIQKYFPDVTVLLLVSNDVYTHCVTNYTEVQTQIKICSKTGTAQDGALRYQELLPTDSVLYVASCFSKALDADINADIVKQEIQNTVHGFLQVGGDETLGRGICKVAWSDIV